MTDDEFLTRAEQMRYLTPGQVEDVRLAQAQIHAIGLELSAPEVCLKRRLMSREQVVEITGPETQGEREFGPYTILVKLGEGGMGAVYKAYKGAGPPYVALKILPEKVTRDKELVARFKREAEIACGLNHPNVVRGLDFGIEGDRYYFAMEFVEGLILSDVIEAKGSIQQAAALHIAIQIASALGEIHRRGLVHRDIKPDNVIVDRHGTAKLMDLGLIKSVLMDVTTLTKTGFTLGTPQYMAYEQIMGRKDLDGRADIYSLGATLYHMVAGVAPFEGVGMMDLLQNYMKLKLPDPRARAPGLTAGFIKVLSRMIAKERDNRYGNAEALLEDLRRVHNGREPQTRSIAVLAPPRRKP